jgi:thermostable 8-oxoguanine DNA glycosylase
MGDDMTWQISYSESEIKAIKDLVKIQADHPFFIDRKHKNLSQEPVIFNEEEVWQAAIMCLVTSQNRSGQGSRVYDFLYTGQFPMTLEILRKTDDTYGFIYDIFSELSIRFWKTNAERAFRNFQTLENGFWGSLRSIHQQLNDQKVQVPQPQHYLTERFASKAVQVPLIGIGPKQSRNFWQSLGLTRYEIPIDSRVLKWFEQNLNIEFPNSGLQDENFYCMVQDSIRDLCSRANILPCMLDIAIFSSYEK